MNDFSDLHLTITRVRQRCRGSFGTVVNATGKQEPPGRCAKCGDPRSPRRHGKKITVYRDLPQSDGAIVAIAVERARFRCQFCRATFLQRLPDMDHKFRMTERAVERIRIEVVQRPFSAIAADFGIHEKTVRRIARDRVPALTGRARRSTLETRFDEQDDYRRLVHTKSRAREPAFQRSKSATTA
jgi:transposase